MRTYEVGVDVSKAFSGRYRDYVCALQKGGIREDKSFPANPAILSDVCV